MFTRLNSSDYVADADDYTWYIII